MKECNCHRGPEVKTKTVGCPPKVIQINNPAEPVLFHRVDIPAIMGDDVTYPPENGLYKNVLLVYEANNHIYLYNSDGIPTSLTVNTSELEEALEELGVKLDETAGDLAQETTMREGMDEELQSNIDAVAQDLEDFKNSPDVVDIVPTYAALQAYDTSALGDKDEIRVLQDETHDGASAYYRWDKPNGQWIFIGITGPYYTKNETDTLIEAAKTAWAGTETTSSSSGSTAEVTTTAGDFEWKEGHTVIVNFIHKANRSLLKVDSETAYSIDNVRSLSGGIDTGVAIQYVCTTVGGQRAYRPIGRLRASSDVAGPVFIADNLTTTGAQLTALSANQGKVLNDRIGDLTTLTTAAKTSAVAAINEVNGNVGLAKVLTPDDYNYPANNPSSIALWLLEPGLYVVSGDSTMISYSTTNSVGLKDSFMYLVQGGQYGTVLEIGWGTATGDGGRQLGGKLYTYSGPGALTAHSGKSLITTDYLEISYGVPSATGLNYTSNGKIYIDTETAKAYQYINISGGANRGWVRFGAEEISSTDWDALWS